MGTVVAQRPETGTRKVTGPRGLVLIRNLWRLRSDPLQVFLEGFDAFGDIYEVSGPGIHQYTFYRADHAEHILVRNQDNYAKGPQFEILGKAIGNGLVTSSGELWRRQRKLIQPMFAKRHLEPLARHMTGGASHMLDSWDERLDDGDRVDMHKEMTALVLDVVGRALFGTDLTGATTATIGRVTEAALEEVLAAMISPLTWAAYALPGMNMDRALKLRPRRQRRLRAAMAELDAIIAAMIASHRDGARVGDDDLLTLLLDARDEETGAPMSDQQVRDEVATFISAGHETTASSMSFMWWLLSENPEARERLHAEVDELVGDRTPDFADADRLLWTRAVVQEAIRLYPPVWSIARQVVEDDEIDGVPIKAGSMVGIVIYKTHRDPAIWPDPERFDPSRFLSDQVKTRPRHSFLPFSAGRRVCVGNTFALTEATLLTAMIARRYQLDTAPGHKVETEVLNTLRPRGGLPMTVRRRTGS